MPATGPDFISLQARDLNASQASYEPYLGLVRSKAGGHAIVSAPIDGPFGRTFTFADTDGYQVTLHDRA